jgi:hypothetical protein
LEDVMSSISRRSLVTTAAALPVLAVPAGVATAADDSEPSRLIGQLEQLEQLEREWLDRTVFELKGIAAREAACERAGVPRLTDEIQIQMSREERGEYWRRRTEVMSRLPDDDDGLSEDEYQILDDRIFALKDEIQNRPLTTLAGLAVLTRATVLSEATRWVYRDGDEDYQDFIGSVCEFLGIVPIMEIALAAVDAA